MALDTMILIYTATKKKKRRFYRSFKFDAIKYHADFETFVGLT